ncbi:MULTISPECIES: alpha/beta fold hydrolase [unclassified Corynebacterium]|uniref:alpha/beta fold hydrolase n=1 Tax=unclassified Corynebacterium TaxID=2624378 RepID=UPI0029CA64C8|nr:MULTISPECIES: alpha/beta fold hydrolase [unclassified Corynebacterium]WPF65791.1 alpha/beta fold hydrolase [Corynebacterium sp. 22KM0430]WPF68285.1 alpha/beta fold hydrolase [Corynebacterium sp. 21KM1197]
MRLLDLVPPHGVAPYLPGLGTSAATGQRPVLVLHGAAGSPGNFEELLRLLAHRADRTVAAPAYGQRGTARLEHSLAEVEACARRLVAASPEGLIDVVGHSLGGLLGLLLAQRLPVARLIGLGACFRGCPPRFPRLMGRLVGPVYPQIMRPLDIPPPTGTQIVSIVSPLDTIVPPEYADLSAYSGARVEMVTAPGVLHYQFPEATAREVFARLYAESR